MRALIAVTLSMLGGCAATQHHYLPSFDETTRRLSCPPGTYPVYIVNGFDRRADGCADTRELQFLFR